jgi:uncharacterized protein (TIGR00288 family)
MVLDKMELKENNEDVVVFFDFENIVYSLRQSMGKNPNFEILMEKCQEYGRVVMARAYADWGRHSTVIAPLQASGFDPVYVPTYFYDNQERRTRKNAVDIHIAIEAVEVMFTQPHINIYVLLTGDKDFIPLANALRRYGKTVIAIGVKGTTSPYMRQATDDFVYYHQLFEEPNGRRREAPKKDIYAVLVEAVKKLQREEQKTVFPQVKHAISEILGSFDEKNYTDAKGVPFSRFKDFILEAQRLRHVKLVTTGSVNEVLLPGDLVSAVESAPPPLSVIEEPAVAQEEQAQELTYQPPTVITDAESAFDLLLWAVNHAQEAGKSLRASSIKTIMRGAVHDFDEKELPGESFSKFSDFTRAAARRGLVHIEGKGILMEVHPGVGTQPKAESAALAAMKPGTSDLPEAPHSPIPAITEEAAPTPVKPISTEIQYVSLEQQEPYVSDYRMRVLVVDALRNCKYPAPAHVIGQHCLNLSERRQIALPNRRLNQLLTSARDIGLLQPTNENNNQPQQYTFANDAKLVSQFIDGETLK